MSASWRQRTSTSPTRSPRGIFARTSTTASACFLSPFLLCGSGPQTFPLLCNYYLAFFARQYGKPGKVLTRDALDVLIRYAWPGNVRELRNLMEWVLIMVPSPEVRTSDLPIQPGAGTALPDPGLPWSGPLKEAREAYEREFIRRALGRHGGERLPHRRRTPDRATSSLPQVGEPWHAEGGRPWS